MLTGAKQGMRKLLQDVQSSPAVFAREGGLPSVALMVDGAALIAGKLIVRGWFLGELEFEVYADDELVASRVDRFARDDVVRALGLPAGAAAEPGFVLLAAPQRPPAEIVLRWKHSRELRGASGATALRLTAKDERAWLASLGPGAAKLAWFLKDDPEWLGKAVRAASPQAAAAGVAAEGNIEYAGSLGELGGIAFGWAFSRPDVELWLFDELGHGERLEGATRNDRADIRALYWQNFGRDCLDAGFLMRWPGNPKVGSGLKLAAVGPQGLKVVSAAVWQAATTDPGAFARHTFGVQTRVDRLQDRMLRHDGVLIERLLARRNAELQDLPVDVWRFGPVPSAPRTSVIVPLYGRSDFVEHQLLEFTADPDFRATAELIYVIDDPLLLAMKARAEDLWKTYGVPFKLVWGHVNRGFAGANNLGARQAAGEVLLFLNSDAFPKAPGWVSRLADALAGHPDFAAIGARLLFADGGIQHAGMAFEYDAGLGVWLNKHPMMGVDPSLDTRRGLIEQPAVTAACVAVRRDAFEQVGGFDGGFLYGDFEDSDLCLKLSEKGYRIGYLPEVELVHLERQSFPMLGDNSFRQSVVLFNAGRHTRKWAGYFAGLGKAPPPQEAPAS